MTVRIPDNYVSGGFAMEYEVPWMTPGAVKRLDELVKPTDNVIEVGTGGSTLFFARRAQSVIGIEPNLEWADSVIQEASVRNINSADLSAESDPGHEHQIPRPLGACAVL